MKVQFGPLNMQTLNLVDTYLKVLPLSLNFLVNKFSENWSILTSGDNVEKINVPSSAYNMQHIIWFILYNK